VRSWTGILVFLILIISFAVLFFPYKDFLSWGTWSRRGPRRWLYH